MILLAGDFENSGTDRAWALLKAQQSALTAIEQGIRAVEANEADTSVGIGGYPNALGQVELDAGVMDGRSRASGAVGALQGCIHPISVAYQVMQRLPHVLLVGAGAARFAAEIGAEQGSPLTEAMRDRWQAWWAEQGLGPEADQALMEAVFHGRDPQRSGGTTVYLAQDHQGDIAVATSTSGWAWKYPGRLGDTPIAGAGFYADNRYGAAACTGMGEIAIRSGLARMVVAYMQMGQPVDEAVQTALADVGYHKDQTRGITVYAIDAQGRGWAGCIPQAGRGPGHYYIAVDGDDAPVRRDAFDLSHLASA